MTNKKLNVDSLVATSIPSGDVKVQNFPTENDSKNKECHQLIFKPDVLVTFTDITKSVLTIIGKMTRKIKKTPAYKVISSTTQPIHAASIILVTVLSMIFFPVDRKQSCFLTSKFTYLTYFTAFSLHAGSQFWMTFISGLSLYFNLTRHAFGDVQKILFPRYFTFNCFLSAITVIQFGRLHASIFKEWNLHIFLQIIALTLCFVVEFYIRIYLAPSITKLITMKTSIEKAAGIGQEVGRYELGPLMKCPQYMSIYRAFRKLHMYSATGNIIAIMCSAFHLYYLAYRAQIQ